MICFQLNLLKPFKSFQHQFNDLWYQLLYEIKSKFTVWFEWPIEMSDLKFSKYWHLIEKWTLTRKRGSRFGYITSVISIQRLWFAAIDSFQNATTTRYLGQMINSTEMWIMFWSSCDFRFFKRFSVGEFFWFVGINLMWKNDFVISMRAWQLAGRPSSACVARVN